MNARVNLFCILISTPIYTFWTVTPCFSFVMWVQKMLL